MCFSPEGRTADAVNERIATTVAHGQPMRDQEDEIDVLELVDGWMAHAGQEVDLDVRTNIICLESLTTYLVWEPAEAEDDDHGDEHHHGPLLLVEVLSVLGNRM